jgi:hypothetical protein
MPAIANIAAAIIDQMMVIHAKKNLPQLPKVQWLAGLALARLSHGQLRRNRLGKGDIHMKPLALLVPSALVLAFFSNNTIASPTELVVTKEIMDPPKVYSPFVGRDYPDQVFFGDTHFHTNLVRPLDFLVITDHSELIGLAPQIQNSAPELLADPWGKWVHERFNAGPEGRMEAFGSIIAAGTTGQNPMSSDEAVRSIWEEFVHKAEGYNEPGRFTAMTGFEWSSTLDGDNLHRCIIFRDAADKTEQVLPYSMFDSPDPEDLWKFLAAYEEKTSGQAIAIPHNGNLSNGAMFSDKTFSGKRLTRSYAEARNRWEPLHEVSQVKGDEEAHAALSPEDEFADFETWDAGNLDGSAAKEDWMLQQPVQVRDECCFRHAYRTIDNPGRQLFW